MRSRIIASRLLVVHMKKQSSVHRQRVRVYDKIKESINWRLERKYCIARKLVLAQITLVCQGSPVFYGSQSSENGKANENQHLRTSHPSWSCVSSSFRLPFSSSRYEINPTTSTILTAQQFRRLSGYSDTGTDQHPTSLSSPCSSGAHHHHGHTCRDRCVSWAKLYGTTT